MADLYSGAMARRNRLVGIVAGAVSGVVVVAVPLIVLGVVVTTPDPSCADKLKADEAKVRTSRWKPTDQLPGLGRYIKIHWQARAAGNPCSRAPGPTDWTYQGVVQLHPEDARSLAANYHWQPVAAATSSETQVLQVWSGLAEFVPDNVRWLYSDAYDQAPPHGAWRRLYLDPDRALVLFALSTS